jgi:hypothetical protein
VCDCCASPAYSLPDRIAVTAQPLHIRYAIALQYLHNHCVFTLQSLRNYCVFATRPPNIRRAIILPSLRYHFAVAVQSLYNHFALLLLRRIYICTILKTSYFPLGTIHHLNFSTSSPLLFCTNTNRLISLTVADEQIPSGVQSVESLNYHDSALFPPWMLNSQSWSKNKIVQSGNVMSDILKIPANIRTPEQINGCIRWLMSRWKIAETMGMKRCASMFKEFKV